VSNYIYFESKYIEVLENQKKKWQNYFSTSTQYREKTTLGNRLKLHRGGGVEQYIGSH